MARKSVWLILENTLRELTAALNEELYRFQLDLTPIEFYILLRFSEQEKWRPSDLAQSVGRYSTSFTPILDGLEEKGLILRTNNPTDRRSIYLCLTETGEEVLKSVLEVFDNVEEHLFKSISNASLRQILADFQRINIV